MPITDKAKNAARARKWYADNQERVRAKQKIYYQANKEKALAYGKQWRADNPDKQKNAVLKFHYGISLEDYNALFEAQGFACGACGNMEARHKKGWHLDHCHDTKKVRGILCHHCNVSLGHMQDDPVKLRALADYIEKHR